jgi:hypothetical protein
MLNNLPVSEPQTLYDWLAVKESNRDNLAALQTKDLAVLYGLAYTPLLADPSFCAEIETVLEQSPDPVRARYEFAYILASHYWDKLTIWAREIATLMAGRDVNDPLANDEWSYDDLLPKPMIDKAKHWLTAGARAMRSDEEMMQLLVWVKSRACCMDTIFLEEDVEEIEAELGEEIDIHNNAQVQALFNTLKEAWMESFGKDAADDEAQEDNDPDE